MSFKRLNQASVGRPRGQPRVPVQEPSRLREELLRNNEDADHHNQAEHHDQDPNGVKFRLHGRTSLVSGGVERPPKKQASDQPYSNIEDLSRPL